MATPRARIGLLRSDGVSEDGRKWKRSYFFLQEWHTSFGSNAEPQRSSAEFFAALPSRESKQFRHSLRSREEVEQHTAPAENSMSGRFSSAFNGNNARITSTNLKPSAADCVAAGAAVEAARLAAGTMA